MLTVGVLYPATDCRIYTLAWGLGILYGMRFVYGLLYLSVGFLHCLSPYQGNAKAYSLEMDENESHAFLYRV